MPPPASTRIADRAKEQDSPICAVAQRHSQQTILPPVSTGGGPAQTPAAEQPGTPADERDQVEHGVISVSQPGVENLPI